MGIFQAKPKLTISIADRERELAALQHERDALVTAYSNAQAEANNERAKAEGFRSDGTLLLTVTDSEVESHGAKLRNTLRAEGNAKLALDNFDSVHPGGVVAIMAEIQRLGAEREREAQQAVRSKYRDNRARALDLSAKLAEVEAEAQAMEESAWRLWPVDADIDGVHLAKQAGLIDARFPEGTFSVSVKTAPGSSVFAGVRVRIGLFDESLLDDSDPMRARVDEARRKGMLLGTLQFLHM